MSALDIAQKYFDTWNTRHPEAVVSSMAPNGTYEDPMTPGPISGPGLVGHVGGTLAAFPDLSFEIVYFSLRYRRELCLRSVDYVRY
jgi:hypothetical protein